MFGLFSNKKKRFVGIDFGTSAIKLVELEYRDQKTYLRNYAWADLSNLFNQGNASQRPQTFEDKLSTCLSELVRRAEVKDAAVYLAIPGFSGLITLIEFPQMADGELSQAIQYEAHKYIPTSLDEIAMSWEVIDMVEEEGQKKMHVLLVAAPKKEISRYEGLINAAGLKADAIELETFSIVRSLVGEDDGTFLIVDMGARATNILLVEKGIVRVNRNIDAGGNEVTETVAESMGISKNRAETLKKGEKDLISGKEGALVVPVLELIANEARRIANAYKQRNPQLKIESVILSGGSVGMKGVKEFFAASLGIPAVIGDPWRHIIIDERAKENVRELGTSYTVALGLALRGLDEYKQS